MHKRYVVLIIVSIVVCLLVWKISSSYGLFNQGFEGENIVSGDKWSLNIVEVSDIETTGGAIIDKEVSTIGTTLSFGVSLFEVGDAISFDFTVENTGKLDAELYATTLFGLSSLDSEVISYEIIPLDYVVIHEDENDGSIIKNNERQSFTITVKYDGNVSLSDNREYNLGLGSTIIYKQK